MKSLLSLALVFGLAATAPAVYAQNLLDNGNLEASTTDPFPFEQIGSAALLIGFANYTPAGQTGLWLQAFVGRVATPATVILQQDVPGTPGTEYQASVFSRWENNYSGGVTTLSSNAPDGAVPSPTVDLLHLTFLDSAFGVLADNTLNLRTVQQNGGDWRQVFVSGVAPAGTATVRVAYEARNMVFNTDPQQSAFVDDFSLVVIPEPASALLAMVGLAGVARRRR